MVPSMNRMQSLAARIAWMPLAVGLASLIVWCLSQWGPLLVVGYGSLAIGVLGAFFVPVLLLRAWPTSPKLRPTVLIGALALANLPATFYCAITGMEQATRYRITVHNRAETSWSGLHVTGAGVDQQLGALAPLEVRTWNLWFRQEGSLELHHGEPGQRGVLVVESYVAAHQDGGAMVVRSEQGEVSVLLHMGR